MKVVMSNSPLWDVKHRFIPFLVALSNNHFEKKMSRIDLRTCKKKNIELNSNGQELINLYGSVCSDSMSTIVMPRRSGLNKADTYGVAHLTFKPRKCTPFFGLSIV